MSRPLKSLFTNFKSYECWVQYTSRVVACRFYCDKLKVMEYIVHGSKNQIDSSIFTYFGAICMICSQQIETSYSFHSNRSKVSENTTIKLKVICTWLISVCWLHTYNLFQWGWLIVSEPLHSSHFHRQLLLVWQSLTAPNSTVIVETLVSNRTVAWLSWSFQTFYEMLQFGANNQSARSTLWGGGWHAITMLIYHNSKKSNNVHRQRDRQTEWQQLQIPVYVACASLCVDLRGPSPSLLCPSPAWRPDSRLPYWASSVRSSRQSKTHCHHLTGRRYLKQHTNMLMVKVDTYRHIEMAKTGYDSYIVCWCIAACGNGEDGTCRQTDTEKDRQKLLFAASTMCLNYDSKIRA